MINVSSVVSGAVSVLKRILSFLEGIPGQISHIFFNLHINLSLNISFSGIVSSITSVLNYLNIHVNFLLLSILPSGAIKYVGPASLLIAGNASEKHWIGRITVFTNTIALNVFIYYFMQNPNFMQSSVYISSSILLLYANIGFILGFAALHSYKTKGKTGKWFRKIAWTYSSVVIGGLIIFLTLITY